MLRPARRECSGWGVYPAAPPPADGSAATRRSRVCGPPLAHGRRLRNLADIIGTVALPKGPRGGLIGSASGKRDAHGNRVHHCQRFVGCRKLAVPCREPDEFRPLPRPPAGGRRRRLQRGGADHVHPRCPGGDDRLGCVWDSRRALAGVGGTAPRGALGLAGCGVGGAGGGGGPLALAAGALQSESRLRGPRDRAEQSRSPQRSGQHCPGQGPPRGKCGGGGAVAGEAGGKTVGGRPGRCCHRPHAGGAAGLSVGGAGGGGLSLRTASAQEFARVRRPLGRPVGRDRGPVAGVDRVPAAPLADAGGSTRR